MAVLSSYASCPSCGFPVSGRPGQAVTCPNCGISGTITGVSIPDPLFWGGVGIIIGLVLSRSKIVAAKLSRL